MQGQRLHHVGLGGLGGGVDEHIGVGLSLLHGTDGHDAAPAGFLHVRDGGLDEQQGGDQVAVELIGALLGGDVLPGVAELHRGVEHHHIGLGNGTGDGLGGVQIAQVGGDDVGTAAGSLDLSLEAGQLVGGLCAVEDHPETVSSQTLGNGTANASGRAGNKGCFQALASGEALIYEIRKNKLEGLFGKKEISVKDISEKIKENDKIILELIKKQAFYIGTGIANIINIFNPSEIIINGYISSAPDFIKAIIKDEINKKTLPGIKEDANVLFSHMEDEGKYKGAVGLFISELFDNPEVFF